MKFSIKNLLVLALFFVSSVCNAQAYEEQPHQISPEEIQELKSHVKYDDLSDPEQKNVDQNIETLQLIINRSWVLEKHIQELDKEIVVSLNSQIRETSDLTEKSQLKQSLDKFNSGNHYLDAREFLHLKASVQIEEYDYYKKQHDKLFDMISKAGTDSETMKDADCFANWPELTIPFDLKDQFHYSHSAFNDYDIENYLNAGKESNFEKTDSDTESNDEEVLPEPNRPTIPKLNFSKLSEDVVTPRSESTSSREVSSDGLTPEQQGAVKFWGSKFSQASSRRSNTIISSESSKTNRDTLYKPETQLVKLSSNNILFGQTPRVVKSSPVENKQFRNVAVQTGESAQSIPFTARLKSAVNSLGSQTARGARSVLDTARETTESLYEKSRKAFIGEQAFNREKLLRPKRLEDSDDDEHLVR
ncbi:MAG: hypothetical protein NTU89_00495 [Candidatus Dependentiae bacterium]|nr:hypothetical protein [Candidatus Dependentiae bacterium]